MTTMLTLPSLALAFFVASAPAQNLVFSAQPSNAAAGAAIAPAVKVSVVDAFGAVIPVNGVRIGIDLQSNPGGGALSGTKVQLTANGVATFSDLSINKTGSGYSLVAWGRALPYVTSAPFDITPGAPARLEFTQNGGGAKAWEPPAAPFALGVLDAFDNVASNVSVPITLTIGSNPGSNLIHASGVGFGVLELVDHETPALLPPLAVQTAKSVSAMTYDGASGMVYAADLNNNLSVIDPQTGAQTFITVFGPLPASIKGMVADGATGMLLGVDIMDNILWIIDPMTGAPAPLGSLTIAGDFIQNVSGLAMDPATGTLYGSAQLASLGATNRMIVTIDPMTLAAAAVGPTGDKPAGLAFRPDGSLVAVIGDGGTAAEQLMNVNKTTGAMAPLLALGNGDSGEAIATVPAQLRGTLTMILSGGAAVFNDVRVTAAGAGYTLVASSPGLASAESRAFDISRPDVSGLVSFTSASQSAGEAAGSVVVTLQVSPAQNHEVVAWITVAGSAFPAPFPGADHDLLGFVDLPFAFAPGQTAANITINITNDASVETNETILLSLKRAALATLGSQLFHTVTIIDND